MLSRIGLTSLSKSSPTPKSLNGSFSKKVSAGNRLGGDDGGSSWSFVALVWYKFDKEARGVKPVVGVMNCSCSSSFGATGGPCEDCDDNDNRDKSARSGLKELR